MSAVLSIADHVRPHAAVDHPEQQYLSLLRDILDKTPVGHLTPPELTKQGIEMVALCGRKATTVDTPKKREMRDKMYVQKYEAKSKAYLQEVRKAAMIEYPGGR